MVINLRRSLTLPMLVGMTCLLVGTTPIIPVCQAQPATFPAHPLPKFRESLVLSLRYTTSKLKRPMGEHSIGFYDNTPASSKPHSTDDSEDDSSADTQVYRGLLLTTDKNGWLYFYDPITSTPANQKAGQTQHAMRVFDKGGHEVRRWLLPPHLSAYSASVTQSGVLWIAVEGEGDSLPATDSTLPILAYEPGKAQPIVNWLDGMPPDIEKAMKQTRSQFLKDQEANPPETSENSPVGYPYAWIYAGSKMVRLDIYEWGDPTFSVSLDVTNRGQYIATTPSKSSWQLTTPFLDHADVNYFFEDNSTPENTSWDRLWFWKQGQKRGAPLVTEDTLTSPTSWWTKTLGLEYPADEIIYGIGVGGSVYLTAHRKNNLRENPRPPLIIRTPGNAPMKFEDRDDYAVVVFDAQRRAIGYLPWKTTYLGEDDDLIFPTPDGKGFYRQEFSEKSLNIYWHSLPIQPQTPTKKP